MNTRPLVVQVVNSLARAGAERVAVDLAVGLAGAGWDSRLLVVRDGPLRQEAEAASVKVHVTGGEFDLRWPVVVARMHTVLKRWAPEVVHTHMIGSDIVGRLAAFSAGVPVIVGTQHDIYDRAWYYDLFRKWSSRRIDALVAISDTVAEHSRESFSVSVDRIVKIPNSVDVERFAPSRMPWRQPPVFGALGTLIPVKGHRYLVEAFAQVTEEIPGAKLLIAGEGPERPALEDSIGRLGLGDSVGLLGRIDDVAGFLRGIDVFVHPSTQEGMPVAVLEAMAAAKPVIATEGASLPEAIAEHAGRVVSVADTQALADAMKAVASDPQDAHSMGMSALARVARDYSLDAAVEAHDALYRTLASAKGIELAT